MSNRSDLFIQIEYKEKKNRHCLMQHFRLFDAGINDPLMNLVCLARKSNKKGTLNGRFDQNIVTKKCSDDPIAQKCINDDYR